MDKTTISILRKFHRKTGFPMKHLFRYLRKGIFRVEGTQLILPNPSWERDLLRWIFEEGFEKGC